MPMLGRQGHPRSFLSFLACNIYFLEAVFVIAAVVASFLLVVTFAVIDFIHKYLSFH